LGLGKGAKNVLGSAHVVDQLSFCMFPSFLIFDFCLIFGSFLMFGVLMGYFGGRVGFDNCFGVYSCSSTTFIFYFSINSDVSF